MNRLYLAGAALLLPPPARLLAKPCLEEKPKSNLHTRCGRFPFCFGSGDGPGLLQTSLPPFNAPYRKFIRSQQQKETSENIKKKFMCERFGRIRNVDGEENFHFLCRIYLVPAKKRLTLPLFELNVTWTIKSSVAVCLSHCSSVCTISVWKVIRSWCPDDWATLDNVNIVRRVFS